MDVFSVVCQTAFDSTERGKWQELVLELSVDSQEVVRAFGTKAVLGLTAKEFMAQANANDSVHPLDLEKQTTAGTVFRRRSGHGGEYTDLIRSPPCAVEASRTIVVREAPPSRVTSEVADDLQRLIDTANGTQQALTTPAVLRVTTDRVRPLFPSLQHPSSAWTPKALSTSGTRRPRPLQGTRGTKRWGRTLC